MEDPGRGSPAWWNKHTVIRLVVTHLNRHGARVLFVLPRRGLALVARTPGQAEKQLAYARERWPEGAFEVHAVRFWKDVDGQPEDPVHTLIDPLSSPAGPEGVAASPPSGPAGALPGSSASETLPTTVWMVVVQDKDLAGEPDVGLGLELSTQAAARLGDRLVDELARAGRSRCVYRTREVEIGIGIRIGALLHPAPTLDETTPSVGPPGQEMP